MPAIEIRTLRKVYPLPSAAKKKRIGLSLPAVPGALVASGGVMTPEGIVALDALDLDIGEGEFFGLLGPNGAGKTTTIGILTTRVVPTAGSASVAGADVRTDPVGVRARIGVVPQRPNPDRSLSAFENLVFHAAYFGVPTGVARERAHALMDRLGIGDRPEARVDELSGGQQQRLMIARALIHEPSVIFLDEPTVGLDPQARLALWDILRELHREGRTIVMTTHYMEEADKLCERIAIVDRGKLLALDTPAMLKRRAPGGTLIELTLDGDAAEAATGAQAVEGVLKAEAKGPLLRVYSDRGGQIISPVLQVAESRGRHVRNIGLTEPSLETLFISLTGRKLD